MSSRSPSERLADFRHETQLLAEQAGDHEANLEGLVAAAERDIRYSAASQSTDLDLDELQHLLSEQRQRNAAAAVAVRRLCVGARQQHAAARRLLAHVDGDQTAGAQCQGAVLVVDDQSDIRELLAHVLEDAGFVVRTAANGLEALIKAYQMRPSVIVMDVSMPVLDGIEATRLIKAGEATRDARVIAYTGNQSFDDSPIRALFAAVLSKPATARAVLATVQRVAGFLPLAASSGDQRPWTTNGESARARSVVRSRDAMEGVLMHRVGIPERRQVLALTALEEEDVAAHSAAKLLISGASRRGVETFARRIHHAGHREQAPFVHQRACELPIEPEALREQCSRFLDAAAGGSLLISGVEDMPPVVQESLIELLAELESASRPLAAVRLISGTTVSLFDRVVAGAFSARLFYRLNIIHLVAGDRSDVVTRV